MPNWCEGTLKVRGKEENIKKFVLEGLMPVNIIGEELEPLKENEYGEVECDDACWIKGTRRGFVENLNVYFDNESDIIVKTFEAKFAWRIEPPQLLNICEEFNVDMKIHAFECGQEFNQIVEIVNGKILNDQVITFNDYQWDCICPTFGG